MRLAVLNPRGKDPEQAFADFAGAPDDVRHPPVNFHAFAACTGGGFHRVESTIPADSPVLLLLRGNLKEARQSMVDLRRAGKVVVVSLKETGAMQVAELLEKPARLDLFREICERAAGAIATTEDTVPLYRSAGARAVEFIPTPYPLEDPRWDFSPEAAAATKPATAYEDEGAGRREGIFVGTREFHTPSRNHLAALLVLRSLAESMGQPVTVFNTDGWRGGRLLRRLGYPEGYLKVIEGRRAYPAYLRLLARHRLVFQLDASAVPGQVAGDALLCRTPCIGGNGTVERMSFPGLCGHGRSVVDLLDLAARLLDHPHDCVSAGREAVEMAKPRLSYEQGAKFLRQFLVRLGA